MNILIACMLVVFAIMCIPAMLILVLWALAYGIILIPIAGIGYLVYRMYKNKIGLSDTVPPIDATDANITEERKPMTIKWNGQELPIGVAIVSILMACILTPILITLFLVYVPFMCKIALIGCAIGMKVISNINKATI